MAAGRASDHTLPVVAGLLAVGTLATVTAGLLGGWAVGAAGAGVALLVAVGETYPVMVRHTTRQELVTLASAPLGIGVFVLEPDQIVVATALGALLMPPLATVAGPTERVRHSPPSRRLFNVGKVVVSVLPAAGLAVLARQAGGGLVATSLAAAGGVVLASVVSQVLVRAVLRRAAGRAFRAPTVDLSRESVSTAMVEVGVALPVGILATRQPVWPLLIVLGAALAAVSRARLVEDTSAHHLAALTDAAPALAAAPDVASLHAGVAATLRTALRCGEVALVSEAPVETRDLLVARLGADGPWCVASGRELDAPWTIDDRRLLDAVVALAAAERARLRVLHDAREAERFVSMVLTTAGHDIGHQLHTTRAAMDTLREGPVDLDDGHPAGLHDTAAAALGRAEALLRDLLSIGVTAAAASTTGAELALFARGLGDAIRVEAEDVRIAAPRVVVERAVENLVRNAERHHRGDEPLVVEVVGGPDGVAVSVSDRGPGLPAHDVSELFAAFSQLSDGQRRPGRLGLGLFIARGLAENLGGSLDYRDRAGGGATFVLRLPSAREDLGQRRKERIVLGARADRHA